MRAQTSIMCIATLAMICASSASMNAQGADQSTNSGGSGFFQKLADTFKGTQKTNDQVAPVATQDNQNIPVAPTIRVKEGKTAHIRRSPSAFCIDIIITANSNTPLEKVGEQGSWTKVRCTDKKGNTQEGWISTELLTVVNCPGQPQQQASQPSQPASTDPDNQSISADSIAHDYGGADVDTMFNYISSAEDTFKKSINVLYSVMATEEDRVKIDMELKAANEIQDPKERESKIKGIEAEKEAVVRKMAAQDDCQNRMKALDDQKKQLYAKSVYNVFLAGKYDVFALKQGTGMVQKCKSSPFSCFGFAFKLPKILKVVTTLPTQISNIAELGSTLSKIGSAANIEIQQPKSEAEKPQEVDIG